MKKIDPSILGSLKNLLFLMLILFLDSCSYRHYSSGEFAGLGVQEKKELKVSGSYMTVDEPGEIAGNQFAFQVAHSPIKHLAFSGIWSNTTLNKNSTLELIKSDNSKGFNLGGAIGTYFYLDAEGGKGLLIDFYGYHGQGSIINEKHGIQSSAVVFNKSYLQTGLTFMVTPQSSIHKKGRIPKPSTSFGFNIKFGLSNYYKSSILLQDSEDIISLRILNQLNEKSKYDFIETSLYGELKFRPVTLLAAIILSSNSSPIFRNGEDASLKISLIWNVDDLWNKKETTKID